jgi:Amt family ammonium transporter
MADTYVTQADLDALKAELMLDYDTKFGWIRSQTDVHWMLYAGTLVFLMQAGFAMLEAGTVASKNVSNILFKNIMDACIGAICWWLLGFGFAYGTADDGGFIGAGNFALKAEDGTTYKNWFFQWAFAATAATIVSGAVAERTKLSAYFIYCIVLTSFIYPVVVHWGWDSEGFMCNWGSSVLISGSVNLVDFAGSGIVHMTGGFAGLVGAIMVGPRTGRFSADNPHAPHNKLFCALGVAILWFGWYGFNCGSTLIINMPAGEDGVLYGDGYDYGFQAARVAVTTTIGAAAGGITVMLWRLLYSVVKNGCDHLNFDLLGSLNGVLAGLVSITASCKAVTPEGAFAVGFVGGLVYILSSNMLVKLKIDDPLDACPVHGFCGIWGVLSVAVCGHPPYIGAENMGAQFAMQLVGALIILVWVVVTSLIMFALIKFIPFCGLRVSEEVEAMGLDVSEHGGNAYTADVEMETKSSGATNTDSKVADINASSGEEAPLKDEPTPATEA